MSTLFRWSQHRAIGNSPASKATILVPLVGYLILFNESVVEWVNLGLLFEGQNNDPAKVGWRLLVLYFGLIAVALGTVLYGMFAPKSQVRYPDAHEYARGVTQFHATPEALHGLLTTLANMLAKCERAPISAIAAAKVELKEINTEEVQAWWNLASPEARSAKSATTLLAVYNLEDYRFPALRLLVALFYLLGFGLLAIPSIFVFVRVCSVTMDTVFA